MLLVYKKRDLYCFGNLFICLVEPSKCQFFGLKMFTKIVVWYTLKRTYFWEMIDCFTNNWAGACVASSGSFRFQPKRVARLRYTVKFCYFFLSSVVYRRIVTVSVSSLWFDLDALKFWISSAKNKYGSGRLTEFTGHLCWTVLGTRRIFQPRDTVLQV